MKTLKYILSTVLGASAFWAQSQAIFVQPSPTAADEPMTLYIDVAQTNGGLKTMLTNHPEMLTEVYIWTWMPSDPVGGNGSWGDSNDSRKMTHEGGLLYSLTFVPTEYYGVDGPTFFQRGISCLAKLDSGNAFPDDGVGEAKTEDLHVDIIPKLCDDIYCVFPQLAKTEDFVTITYDNTQETYPGMQNAGDDVYLYLRVEQDAFTGYYYQQDQATAANTPALKMKQVADKPGFYRLTFIPSEFFNGVVPEGFDVNSIRFFAIRPGVTYPVFNLPFETYSLLDCSN